MMQQSAFFKKILLLAFVLPLWHEARSQSPSDIDSHLLYPSNRSSVIYDFQDNEQELSLLHGYISELLSSKTDRLSSLRIHGYSFPDGSYSRNERLSRERSRSLGKYVVAFFPG